MQCSCELPGTNQLFRFQLSSPPPAPVSATAGPSDSAELVAVEARMKDVRDTKPDGRADLGPSFGINNGSGLGATIDVRVHPELFSAGVDGGWGAWGWRVTPHGRYYPLGLSKYGLFGELGVGMNSGVTETYLVSTTLLTVRDQKIHFLFTPTLNLAAGWRFTLPATHLLFMQLRTWASVEAGWSFRLRKNDYVNESGFALANYTNNQISAAQPGGFLAGVALGCSFLTF